MASASSASIWVWTDVGPILLPGSTPGTLLGPTRHGPIMSLYMSSDEADPSETADSTPPYAKLPGGVSLNDVSEAIGRSGYPLQADVAHVIKHAASANYNVLLNLQEEWTYVDSESDEVRSLDIYSELNFVRRFDSVSRAELGPSDDPPSGHSFWKYGPGLDLLVECKQSEMPYVFFTRAGRPSERQDFPELMGIPSTHVTLHLPQPGEELSPLGFEMSAHDILGISDLPFFAGPNIYAGSISSAVRKSGNKLILTGEEAYKSLMLPLRKAAQHLKGIYEPPDAFSDGWHYRLHTVVALAVLRAPMLASTRQDGEHKVEPIPWVRAWRLEPRTPMARGDAYRYMDVVHESFLPEYLAMLLRDFVAFVERFEMVDTALFQGCGVDTLPVSDEEDEPGEADEVAPPPYETIRALTPAERVSLGYDEVEESFEPPKGGDC